MPYVCYNYTSISLGDIRDIFASPSKPDANNLYRPENALIFNPDASSGTYYQADNSQVNVYYEVVFDSSFNFYVTNYEFQASNVDDVKISLDKNGASTLSNKTISGFHSDGTSTPTTQTQSLKHRIPVDRFHLYAHKCRNCQSSLKLSHLRICGYVCKAPVTTVTVTPTSTTSTPVISTSTPPTFTPTSTLTPTTPTPTSTTTTPPTFTPTSMTVTLTPTVTTTPFFTTTSTSLPPTTPPECRESMTYVCYNYTSISTGDIDSIIASPAKPSSNNIYRAENALVFNTDIASGTYYQADNSQANVYYDVLFDSSFNLYITYYQFQASNVDNVKISLDKNGVPTMSNKTVPGFNLDGTNTPAVHKQDLKNRIPADRFHLYAHKCNTCQSSLKLSNLMICGYACKAPVTTVITSTTTTTTPTPTTSPPECTWSEWTACTKSCSGGIRTRIKLCTDPKNPENNKLDIPEACNVEPCSCNMTYSDYVNILNINPPAEPIGWIEKDGIPGRSSEDEDFHMNDVFPDGITVQLHKPACHNVTCDNGNIVPGPEYPVDGTWNPWGEWSTCTVTCGGGMRNRTRTRDLPRCGGKPAEGDETEMDFTCNRIQCPCSWTSWTSWTDCVVNATGSGTRRRDRDCQPDGEHQFQEECCKKPDACQSPFVLTPGTCPDKCEYLNGAASCTDDEECNITCACPKGQFMYKDSICLPKNKCPCRDSNGNEIPPDFKYTENCKICNCTNGVYGCYDIPNCIPTTLPPCPWNQWSEWSDCSKECGIGRTRTRTRSLRTYNCNIVTEPYETVTEDCEDVLCPHCVVDGITYADNEEIPSSDVCQYCICARKNSTYAEKECTVDPSKIIDCGWTEWSDWGGCTQTCGSGGIRQRTRSCTNPLAKCGGIQNSTDAIYDSCNTFTCPPPPPTTTSYCGTCPPPEVCTSAKCEPTCESVTSANGRCIQKTNECTCPDGTVRHTATGKCVPIEDCKKCIVDGKTYEDGQLIVQINNTICTNQTYVCKDNELTLQSNTSIVDQCPPCNAGWQRVPNYNNSGDCCHCQPVPLPQNPCEYNSKLVPINITLPDNSFCQSAFPANFTSCSGCCNSWDETMYSAPVDSLHISNKNSMEGTYDVDVFNAKSCSFCGGSKEMSFLPLVCGTQKIIKMIGLPKLTSCYCKPCCPSGCESSNQVYTPTAAQCANTKSITLDNKNYVDDNYFTLSSSAYKPSTIDPKYLANPNKVWIFSPENAFTNSDGFYFKAVDTARDFAFMITFNADVVASVSSISFYVKQLSSVQVSWATVYGDGSVNSNSYPVINTSSSGSTVTVPVNAPVRAITIYGRNCPTCSTGGRLDTLVIKAKVCS